MALLSNVDPLVLMDFGPPPDPQPTVARVGVLVPGVQKVTLRKSSDFN
jgi:hypothetical protein